MTSAAVGQFSFEDYLLYNDGTDSHYELVDGELVLMNPPTGQHSLILKFLERTIDQEIKRLGLPWVSLRESGIRIGLRTSRLPDLSVMSIEQFNQIFHKSAVLETSPQLVVEVVSPSSDVIDYRYKKTEYAAARVPEYWIVDTAVPSVSVLTLVEGLYETSKFQGEEQIISKIFPQLQLRARNILEPKQ